MGSKQPSTQLTISLLGFLIANSLLTRYLDPSGTFGILFAVPLWFSTLLWGRSGGLVMAGVGTGLNEIIFLGIGSGFARWQDSPERSAEGVVLEFIAFVAVVLLACLIEKTRGELRTSKMNLEKSRELLSVTEDKFRTLVELAPEAIFVTVDLKIVYANTRLTGMSGYSADELSGAGFLDLVVEEDRAAAAQRVRERLEGRTFDPVSLRYRRKDGQIRWVTLIGGQIDWEGKRGIMYLLDDITERKDLEQRLQQAQKMEAIGRLAGGIAHDFNNVLQVVLGYCELIMMKLDDREAISESVSTIKAAAARAGSLTQHLLAFSRKQILKPEAVNLADFLRQAVTVLRPLLGEAISVALDAEPGELTVMVDPGQLQQVILNLAVNARDALPDGGWLRVSLKRASIAECPSCVEIAVSDTGVGMDEAVLAHLFEPFFTTKEEGKGTGLGLSIVAGIVEQSGGHLRIESKKGIGTTIYIYLPETKIELPEERQESAKAAADHNGGRILLVEDNEAVRSLVLAVLEGQGYTVHAASSGSEALAICHRVPALRLLITDLVLPGMDGEQVAKEVLRLCGALAVIYMTGYVDRVPEAPSGVTRILRKPFRTDELLKEVHEAFGRD